ncbi:16S rRNA (cytosine(1402)-N(4))-methyltransferase RsmH [Patescibacteria group bacterium]|nr:16S rRNA (cytosine(1402)-N(4))-methyltransferase RsmH [Patescibacteria group bacterium]
MHNAVMVSEVLDALQIKNGGRYIDATLGGATHSIEMLKNLGPNGRLISFDVDPLALTNARSKQKDFGNRWQIVESNFRNIEQVANESGLGPFDGILFDLGISSDQLADESKGISFQIDGPLDMRLGPNANQDGLTAATIVNRWSEKELTRLFRVYGEEKRATSIAKAIVARRRQKKFETTFDLAGLIAEKSSQTATKARIHPATKVFQALRIAVNDELESLKVALQGARKILAPNGVIVVISFHSLEDRIVKQTFKSFKDFTVSKKPILPTENEIKINPRARSAKLRVAHKNAIQNQNLCPEPTLLL